MYQPWIFAAVTAAGAGLVAFTVSLQRPPVAPEPVTPLEPIGVRVVPPPTAVSEAVTETPVIELDPIVIRPAFRRVVALTPPAAPVLAERPCSHWRELGPTHVVAGTPSGDLQVRELCE
jgi:hypothetical protein